MIQPSDFTECLKEEGIGFITGVPDSLLNDFCLYLNAELPQDRHVIAANEGNAVALATGYHLATGGIPLVYMQNSGIGNSTNPLLSLTNTDVYSIPLVLLIGWRGEPGTTDHAHHMKQGEVTPEMLRLMDIPYRVLDDDLATAREATQWAASEARSLQSPTALLVRKGVLASGLKEGFAEESQLCLSREQAMACVMDRAPADAIFIATTGRATREIHALRDLRGMAHNLDFLNVGAMGHASSIALGIALGAPKRQVICLDGDAALMMHMGALTTIGTLGAPNLLHVVLNNGAHESVGGQPSAGFEANFTGIAENAGYATLGKPVSTPESLTEAVEKLLPAGRPGFIDARVRKGIRPDLPRKVSHLGLKELLTAELAKDVQCE